MDASPYTLQQVLRIACHHPFYNHEIKYPPSRDDVSRILDEEATQNKTLQIEDYSLVTKKELSHVISRLLGDDSPANTYRHHSYTTITGGGFKRGVPLLWLTDSIENRRHRAAGGQLLQTTKVIEPTDVVLNLHVAGHFYRSLDLTTDYMEHAGATVLPAGSNMPAAMVTQALVQYRANCLSGPVTELIKAALHIASLPIDTQECIKVNKLYYTSEPICAAQVRFLKRIFPKAKIYSGLGSAEIGFWGVSHPELVPSPETEDAIDYIYDTRKMLVEILPGTEGTTGEMRPDPAPNGTLGSIIVTSLQRLRNPLVRYNSGDIGSLHPLPDAARSQFPSDVVDYYRVIRMYGRDPRFTFTWNSHGFYYRTISEAMKKPGWNILYWQIVVDPSPAGEHLTIRVLRGYGLEAEVSDEEISSQVAAMFLVQEHPLFHLVFLRDLSAFERSGTGQKVVRFVDNRNLEGVHGSA